MTVQSWRKWYDANKHPCPVCEKAINSKAKYCRKHKYHPDGYPTGSKAPSWKGGKSHRTGGYIIIQKPEHPRAARDGYVLEHIIVWEETHRKPLPDGWVIHHLNGITSDNRATNLFALPAMKHSLLLNAKAKRIQELEALLNNQHQLM